MSAAIKPLTSTESARTVVTNSLYTVMVSETAMRDLAQTASRLYLLPVQASAMPLPGRFELLDLRTNTSRLLTENENRDASPTFSPDGKRILYVSSVGSNRVVASMALDGSDRELLYTGPGSAWSANYSLDGKFIVMTATHDGEDQLFLMTADGGNLQQVTRHGRSVCVMDPSPHTAMRFQVDWAGVAFDRRAKPDVQRRHLVNSSYLR